MNLTHQSGALVTRTLLCERPHPAALPSEAVKVSTTSQKPLAEPGLRLCEACLTRAERNLAELPVLYEECVHSMSVPPRTLTMERVSGSRSFESLNDAAVDVRHDIHDVLSSWVDMVLEERHTTQVSARTPIPRDPVVNFTQFLTGHLEWLAAHPVAAEFAHELDTLVAEAHKVINSDPVAGRIDLGPCIETNCPGSLSASFSIEGNTRCPNVTCDTGHGWQPHQWLLLKLRIEQRQEKVHS